MENKMYLFKKVMTHKNTSAKICAALFFASGVVLLLLTNGNLIAYPAIAQIIAIILLTASIYIAVAYLLRIYTFSVEPNKHIADDDKISEQFDFIITETKVKRSVKVCHVEMSDVRLVRVVDPTNKKQVAAERKKMKCFTYDTCFAANRQIEIVANISDEDHSILISYDEELFRVFNNILGNIIV